MLRRLYLQIIGRNPTVREFEDYVGTSPDGKSSFDGLDPEQRKRALIDRLLQSREYGMSEFNFWSEMKNEPDNQNMKLFYFWAWLKKQLNDDLPFDQMVFKMMTETGNVFEATAWLASSARTATSRTGSPTSCCTSTGLTLLAPSATTIPSTATTNGNTTK